MMTFKRFEDIDAWQKARELTNAVYAASGRGAFAKDFGLRDQIRRAAVSIMSNIAEGFEGYIDDATSRAISQMAEDTARIIAGLITYLRSSSIKGMKYKAAQQQANMKRET